MSFLSRWAPWSVFHCHPLMLFYFLCKRLLPSPHFVVAAAVPVAELRLFFYICPSVSRTRVFIKGSTATESLCELWSSHSLIKTRLSSNSCQQSFSFFQSCDGQEDCDRLAIRPRNLGVCLYGYMYEYIYIYTDRTWFRKVIASIYTLQSLDAAKRHSQASGPAGDPKGEWGTTGQRSAS